MKLHSEIMDLTIRTAKKKKEKKYFRFSFCCQVIFVLLPSKDIQYRASLKKKNLLKLHFLKNILFNLASLF